MAASKEFLDTFLIHNGVGQKEMLHGKALEKVMDKFQILNSPNVHNMIVSFQTSNKGACEIDQNNPSDEKPCQNKIH